MTEDYPLFDHQTVQNTNNQKELSQEREANAIPDLNQLQQLGEHAMNGIRQYIGMLLFIVKQQTEQIANLEKKLAASDTCKYVFMLVFVDVCVFHGQSKKANLHFF